MQQASLNERNIKAHRMQVQELKDLCKLVVSRDLYIKDNFAREIYCMGLNGSYVYYTFISIGNLESPVVVYTQCDLVPREWIWWNVKTNHVSSQVSYAPTNPNAKDDTVIFSIILVKELPECLNVWQD
jgi:hypothetical protein